ncbi:hypothetical protein SAMN05660443_1865 [Marinospirillum celere]|uniref:DUF2933 domain-containing protein n=1 Tax=Marinospirillum celere TaxID=1122252 RepID=A0A1I1HDX6_9GAMM|nr:hypothetical protein [Marinospirillum celere]SFC20168.1 hypothetical protein SAMN05660443_1865 [Marinospirillum celere]
MKSHHVSMLVMCLVMVGASLVFFTQTGTGLWLLAPMLACMAIHLFMHSKKDSKHENNPPE